jgi:hypothetical protein
MIVGENRAIARIQNEEHLHESLTTISYGQVFDITGVIDDIKS